MMPIMLKTILKIISQQNKSNTFILPNKTNGAAAKLYLIRHHYMAF